jgi:hypothetical protein
MVLAAGKHNLCDAASPGKNLWITWWTVVGRSGSVWEQTMGVGNFKNCAELTNTFSVELKV